MSKPKLLLDQVTLTVSEAATVLRVSRDVAYEAVRRGEIPSLRLGRRIVIPSAGLRHMLEQSIDRADLGQESFEHGQVPHLDPMSDPDPVSE